MVEEKAHPLCPQQRTMGQKGKEDQAQSSLWLLTIHVKVLEEILGLLLEVICAVDQARLELLLVLL